MLFVLMIAFILTMNTSKASEYDIECMVEAIYHEARSEGFVAQIGVMLEQTIGATHYHTWKVSPRWSRSPTFIKLGRVGSHIFYVDKGKQ